MDCITFSTSPVSVDLASKYGYQEWMVSRYIQYVPEIESFLDYMSNRPPLQYIRINDLKIDSCELITRLSKKGFELEATKLPEVFLIKSSRFAVGATLEYLSGYYYIQDLSSCLAVNLLDVKEHMTVLDMAASPGGKTTFIAQKMNNTGSIIALEPNKKRLKSLLFNLSRCGVINTTVWNIDATKISDSNFKFDRVLLDAPCSCDGIIQKDLSRKRTYSKESIIFCAKKQLRLIDAAVKVIKPGGLLIYSTCSFAPEENEFIVNSLFDKYDISLEPIAVGLQSPTKFGDNILNKSLKLTRRFYPHLHNTLGFFIAKIRVNHQGVR